jgi:hypothetical protein
VLVFAGQWLRSPSKGETCNDTGALLPNFAGCGSCGKFDVLVVANREVAEDETSETVEFERELMFVV